MSWCSWPGTHRNCKRQGIRLGRPVRRMQESWSCITPGKPVSRGYFRHSPGLSSFSMPDQDTQDTQDHQEGRLGGAPVPGARDFGFRLGVFRGVVATWRMSTHRLAVISTARQLHCNVTPLESYAPRPSQDCSPFCTTSNSVALLATLAAWAQCGERVAGGCTEGRILSASRAAAEMLESSSVLAYGGFAFRN